MSYRFHIAIWFVLIMIAVVAAFAFAWMNERPAIQPQFGITFSWKYAQDLGFAPEEMYAAMLDELGVRRVRLPIYWSKVEPRDGEYQWEISDRLIQMSQDRGVLLTLVVGMKVPRWPECYIPAWTLGMSAQEQQQATLAFIRAAVERYRDFSAVIRWQVENEPFFPYGECPTITPEQFQERVDAVRQLDDRPIQVTVSGEMEPWQRSARAADILGISMYRETWNDLFGYFVYPLTPDFYYLRARLVKDDVPQVLVSELQAEPWFPAPISSRPLTSWYDSFTAEMFEHNLDFVRESGLPEAYLWGAEWWYALKQAGDDRLWKVASGIF